MFHSTPPWHSGVEVVSKRKNSLRIWGKSCSKATRTGTEGEGCTRRPLELQRSEAAAPSRLNNPANESRCQRVRSSPARAGKGESQRRGGGTEEEKPVSLTLLHHRRPGTAAAGRRGAGLRQGAGGSGAVSGARGSGTPCLAGRGLGELGTAGGMGGARSADALCLGVAFACRSLAPPLTC